jgi:hypothetical protein
LSVRLLRTAAGEFINVAAIARLQREDDGAGWLAILANGDDVMLAPYYSASSRMEQDFAHLVQSQSAAAVPATVVCQAEACCAR